jgi:hypothetical protein
MLSRLPHGLPVRSSSRTDRPLTGDPYDPRATSSALGLRFRSPFPCGFPFGPFRRCSRLVVLRRPLGALLSKPVARLGGWIAFPRDPTGAAPHVVHSCDGARRARPPPLVPHGTASAFPVLFGTAGWRRFRAPSVLRWDYRVRVGRVPAATPVHSTDVCCSQILFSKNFQGCCPSLDARHSAFSHALGELPVHAVRARFGEPARGSERCLLRRPPCRRTSDASSPRGHSRRSYVHRRRPAVVRFWRSDLGSSRGPRPLPPSRVNGSWLRTGPRHLLSSAHSRRPFGRALRDVSRSRSRAPATRSACPADVAL